MSDLISVIVPIYRVEKYLEQCIHSIINQTYKNLEIILVDDGSDDGCGQICDNFAKIDSRIYVIHKKNEGLDRARKTGILASTGGYIGYVDGDDWIEPEMYETLIEKAKKYEVSVVESGIIDSWKDNEISRYPYLEEGCYIRERFIEKVEPNLIYTGDFFTHGVSPYLCTKLFLRENVKKYQLIPGDLNECLNDNLVTYPTIAEGKSIYVIKKCFYHYRVNPESLKRSKRENVEILFKDFYSEFKARLSTMSKNSDIECQIKFYCLYYGLHKIPYIFDDLENNIFLRPFGGVSLGSKIILYGAGSAGIHLKKYIESIPNINLVCWVDKNYQSLKEIYNVCDPKDIMEYEYDYIVISILRKSAVDSVYDTLKRMKVSMEKILWIDEKYLKNPEELLKKATFGGNKLFPYFDL